MRTSAVLLALLLAPPAGVRAWASSAELLKAQGEQDFRGAAGGWTLPPAPRIRYPGGPAGPVRRRAAKAAAAPPLVSFLLSERLDIHRDPISLQLGEKVWAMSLATDAPASNVFLSFSRPDRLLFARLGGGSKLTREQLITLDDRTTYLFRIDVSFFNPLRWSKLTITPANGTSGRSYAFYTGDLLDRLRAKLAVFELGGREYWLAFASDVDPDTSGLAGTRSLLFLRVNGRAASVWVIPEAWLVADRPITVGLADGGVLLSRTRDGRLSVYRDPGD